MSLENQKAQKDLNQLSAEERKLLSSANDVKINDQQEEDSSKMDQSIDVGQSVEEGVKNENGYQEIIGSETSLYDPNNEIKKNKQENKIEKTSCFTKMKQFVTHFFNKLNGKQVEKKFSDNQLVFSIFLRGGVAFYLIKKRKILLSKLTKAIVDEKTLRNIDTKLNDSPSLYFDTSSINQNTLMRGFFTSKQILTKTPIIIDQKNLDQKNNISTSTSRKIILKTDQFENQAVPIPLQSKQNLITSTVAGLTYFLSSNIFKSKIKIDDSLNLLSNKFYFFGSKTSLNEMNVEKVFLNIDWLRIKSDQRALKICALLASSMAAFLIYKSVVSTVVLAKRKKSFFSKLLHEIKEYFQL